MAHAPEPEPQAATPGVERRIVSVLFADLVGFTPLSENLDPEDVATIQDAYFAMVRDTVGRYGGVLEKFIGDAAMAVFGVPRARDDDAERAVRAGLALIGGLEQLEARIGLEASTLQLRVGVNTGEVVHATDGPDAGRVTGDTVNTAARLQAAAEPGAVLLGELTALAVAEAIETRSGGRLELKGKATAVPVWQAIGVRPQPSREEAMGALRAPMLGREAELAQLTAAAKACAEDASASGVTIIAPPGVGKSRLLAEFGASTDARVLRARVRPQATAPYETVAQLLVAAGAHDADLSAKLIQAGLSTARAGIVAGEVARLLAPSAEVAATGADLAAERDARFDAWLAALDVLVGGASLWLVEDVHWAGGDLLAFLSRAASAPTSHGRLVVSTARPSLLETAPDFGTEARIELAPLPPADAEALVEALLGTRLPDALMRAVVDRSDGTPLFIEELLRTWASVGTLVPSDGAWRLTVEPEAVTLPPTVQAIYAAQIDDLPSDARLVARRGSVAGRRVPIEALEALDLAGATGGMQALRRRAFVVGPMSDPITGDAFAYRHALLRDAGYASLARAERARLHAAMASWLDAVAGERADIVAEAVAEHCAAAAESLPALAGASLPRRDELRAKAAHWYERAADAALNLSAIDAAQRMLARAIEHTDADAALDRARLRLRLGEVLAASADLAAAIGELEAARDAYRASLPAQAERFAAATYALGRAYMQQIRFVEAEATAHEALATLGDEVDGSAAAAGVARLMALHAWSIAAQGRNDGALDEASEARRRAEGLGDPAVELDVLEHVAATRDELDQADSTEWSELHRRAVELGRWPQAVAAGRIEAIFTADQDPPAALRLLDRVGELAEAHAVTEQGGWVELARAEAHFVLGEWDRAVEAGLRALAVAERYAYLRLAFRTWVVLLPMFAARRDPTQLERYDAWWQRSEHSFPSAPSPYGTILTAAISVWTAAARSDPLPEPPAAVADAVSPFGNPHFLAGMEAVALAWGAHGRVDLVEQLVARAPEDDWTPLMTASWELKAAWLAQLKGDTDAAVQHARAAADGARSIGATWWVERAEQIVDEPGRAAFGGLGPSPG